MKQTCHNGGQKFLQGCISTYQSAYELNKTSNERRESNPNNKKARLHGCILDKSEYGINARQCI
jgi:hypothetical protein